MRKLIMAGNWKMNKTATETLSFVRGMWEALGSKAPACEIVVAPPYTAVGSAGLAVRGTSIRIAAQNLHWEDEGAFTGEISGVMLKDVGCTHVIIGHSERRQYFGETDETVNKKVGAALRNGLIPIFCVGETLSERESGKTLEVLRRQVVDGLKSISVDAPKSFIMAYEPVWAIGTGKTATPEQAQEAHAFLRGEISSLWGNEFAANVRILYGGSVKPGNSRGLMNREDIDGGLIGGASLKTEDFVGIIKEGTQV
ncbi:triose-phosphate isomerase [Thermodesulfobacteriota bacterium]